MNTREALIDLVAAIDDYFVGAGSRSVMNAAKVAREALDAPAAAPATIQLGAYGAAYDPPGTKRAYTYEHQPGNDIAYRLGEAVERAAAHESGDQIDTGLVLLKALADVGFGVFGLGAETASHPQAQRAVTEQEAGVFDAALRRSGKIVGQGVRHVQTADVAPGDWPFPGSGRPAWVHKKSGGRYSLIGEARVQSDEPLSDMAPVVVYQGEDGALWARSASEFRERFVPTAIPPSEQKDRNAKP